MCKQFFHYVSFPAHRRVSVVDDVTVDSVGCRLAEDEDANCDHQDSVKDQGMPTTEKFKKTVGAA